MLVFLCQIKINKNLNKLKFRLLQRIFNTIVASVEKYVKK